MVEDTQITVTATPLTLPAAQLRMKGPGSFQEK